MVEEDIGTHIFTPRFATSTAVWLSKFTNGVVDPTLSKNTLNFQYYFTTSLISQYMGVFLLKAAVNIIISALTAA